MPWRAFFERLLALAGTTPEPDFDRERAETIRTRSRGIWAAAVVVWGMSLFFFDPAVVPSFAHAFVIRAPEIALGLGLFLWLRRPRTLHALEAMSIASWSLIAALSAYGLLVVSEDKLAVKVASISLAVLVVCPLAAFTARTTAAIGGITTLALCVLKLRGEGTLLLHALTIVGFAFIVLIFSAAARDRLERAEYRARRALSEANDRLRREDEIRRRLFVNLSHDFRTPLGIIGGEAALLRSSAGSAEDAAALARIEGNARSLADLTDQLLELAKLEGKPVCRPRSCDVGLFAREVAALLEVPGSERRVTTLVPASPAVAHADPDQLRRILLNLISNALRHGSRDVTIDVRREAERIVVDVVDDGEGIPSAQRTAIFERFVSFARDGGTSFGVGLPLARELATLNGGSLLLVEDAAKTTFRLALVADENPADELDPVPKRGASAPLPARSRADRREALSVLFVEDNPDMAALLERALGSAFHTAHSSTVAEALSRLESDPPDAVLSDVMLPDGTGYELLAAVRGRRELDAVPVVLVSALAEVGERVRGLSAGADDYLAKPFAPDELRARLVSALERAQKRKLALESQRENLLMEIHDGVSASLSRAQILLSDPTPRAELTAHAREAIRDGLDEIRAITRLLSPRAVEWSLLTAEIRRSMADACAAASITLQFEAEDSESPLPVPAGVAHTLRRVAREATTNVVKHARARSLSCRMAAMPAWLLRLEDDGQGFLRSPNGGQGLGIMRRRVERAGGTINYGNGLSGGAFVVATLARGD